MSAQKKKYDQFYVNNKTILSNVKLLISLIKEGWNVICKRAKMSLSPKLIKSFSSYTSNGYRLF
jgi:hypothetical protein